jgi:hypothetical protein
MVLADGGPLSSLFSANPRIATGPTAVRLQDRFGVVGFLEKYAVEDIPEWGQDITRSINDANLRSGFPERFGNILPVSPRPRRRSVKAASILWSFTR